MEGTRAERRGNDGKIQHPYLADPVEWRENGGGAVFEELKQRMNQNGRKT